MPPLPAAREISFATPPDCGAIAELSRTQIEAGLPWRWTAARVARSVADRASNVVVVRGHDGLLAFGIMKYGEDTAHLLLMAVHPEHRRNGVATALLQWLETVARTAGIARVRLEARSDNAAARAFYARHGYREVQLVRGMYCGMMDGIQLERVLFTPQEPRAFGAIKGISHPD
jgi:ribosomal protein S18 acetylase RimI-like enzyme